MTTARILGLARRVTEWRKERRWEMIELNDNQQQKMEDKLQLYSLLMLMILEPKKILLHSRQIRYHLNYREVHLRSYTIWLKMFYFLCLFFMYYLCESYYKPITVQSYIANCVCWVPRLTLLDLQINWTYEYTLDFILGDSKITAGGDCSHEIKRCLLLGRKALTNLDSILKSRDITLPTKIHLVKAMVFM